MMSQSSQEYDPSKFVKSRSMTGPLPSNYMCFRCGKSGHWIKSCPTNNMDIKRSTGIPRSFMVPVDGPDHKGALLTSTGEYAVPLIDHEAYKEVKKEKPPFLNLPEPEPEPEPQLPDDLLCMACRDLLQDAVLIPCCGNSFCDECARQALLDSENHECPICHETDISPDTLIPNRFLRTAVLNFKNETGYTRGKKFMMQPSVPLVSSSVICILPSTSLPAPEPTPVSVPDSSPVPTSFQVPVPTSSVSQISPSHNQLSVSPVHDQTYSVQVSSPAPALGAISPSSSVAGKVSGLVSNSLITTVTNSSTSFLPVQGPVYLQEPSSSLHPDPSPSLLSDASVTLLPDAAPSLAPKTVLASTADPVLASAPESVLTMLSEPLMTAYSDTVSNSVPIIIDTPQLAMSSTLEVQQLQQSQLEGSHLEVPPLSYNEVELSLPSLPPVVHDQEQVDVLPDLGMGVDDHQPGTPLADEPPVDLEPVDTVDQHTIPENPTCVQTSPFCSFPPDVVDTDSREEAVMHPSEENPSGNIIMTITTTRERGHVYMNSNSRRRHPVIHPHLRIMRNLHGQEERACHQPIDTGSVAELRDPRREENESGRTRHQDQQEGRTTGSHRSRDQISGRASRTHRARDQITYPRRGGSRNQVREPLSQRASSHGRSGRHSSRPQYGTPPREREYRSTSSNYRHSYSEYNQRHTSVHAPSNYEAPPQQPTSHAIAPRFSVQPPQHRIGAPSNYPGQVPPRPPGPSHVLPPTFPPQPPPPGSSPLSHVPPPPGQPPPPGVSPVLPPGPPLPTHHHGSFPPALYGTKAYGTEDFHRELQRLKDRGIGEAMDDFTRELLEYRREQQHRSHGRRQRHGRSRSSSGSHSYSTSKSWSRSGSHSSRSWSRSRSHSFSYSSRSRSRSYSRSRSRSRNRSYSRSRSRSRSYHSRSRSRSRERHSAPSHHYNRSHSRSPKGHRSRGQRSPFQHKKEFSPSFFGTTFAATYPTSAATVPPSASIPHGHAHAANHSLEHYDDRFRYYHDHFRGYEAYHNAYSSQRYDVHNLRHDNKHVQEYQKQSDETHQKSQSREKEKGRDNSRSRGGREYVHKKDIVKPLSSIDAKASSSKEVQDDNKTKKKEEKIKHKKHHHHKNKENKKEKQENTENKSTSDTSKPITTPVNLVKVEVLPDSTVENKKPNLQKETASKEKKHKHKKRKEGEENVKKKSKNVHKDKSSTLTSSESDTTAKAKKRKGKSQIQITSETFPIKEQKEEKPAYIQKGILSEMYTEDTTEGDTTSEIKITENTTVAETVQQTEIEQRILKSDEVEPAELLKQDELTRLNLSSSDSKKDPLPEFTCNDDGVENTTDYMAEQNIAHDEAPVEKDAATQDNKNVEENEDTASDYVLHVEIPAISKWEREEYEDLEETRSPHRGIKGIQKEERNSLPSDIIQRAEKAILQKALKAAIIEIPPTREKHKSDRKVNTEKVRSGEPNKDSIYLKEKDTVTKDQLLERKEVGVSKERIESPTIQITITTDKERRSVQTKKKSSIKERNVDSDSSQSRKMKLDRSKFAEKSQFEEDYFKFSSKDGSQPDKSQSLMLPKEAFTRLSVPKRDGEEAEKVSFSKKNKGRKQNIERSDKNVEEIEKKSHQNEDKEAIPKKHINRELHGHIPDESHSSDDRRLPHAHSRKTDKNKMKDYHTAKSLPLLRGEREERRVREYKNEFSDVSRERRSGVSGGTYKVTDRTKKLQRERSRSRSYDSRDSHSSDRRQHRKVKSYDDNSEIRESRRKDSNKKSYNFNEEKDRKKTVTLNKNSNRERSKVSDNKDQDSSEKKKVTDKKALAGTEYTSSTRHQKESTQDESKFEPNYDETSESEKSSDVDISEKKPKHFDSGKKRKGSPHEGDTPKKHSKRESSVKVHNDKLTPLVKNLDQARQKLEIHKRRKSSSVSSSGSMSQSDIESSSTEKSIKKKVRSESVDSEHKHRHKKSRHKKHKKHKHKHKKKKSYKSRQKD